MNVFISYRREGGYALARLIYECLHKVGIHAFLDLEELRAGPFNEKLYAAIEECDNFLLILPVGALDRCVNENDWLRLEVEHAIKLKKNIIPVMVKGFEFSTDLPETMRALPFYNGVQMSREYFDASMKKLISMLKNVTPHEHGDKFVAEREFDVRYYYDEDEQEKHRLATEDKLPGIMDFKADPDYASCVSLCTKGALHEMVIPAVLAIVVPIATGLILGPTGVVGLLGGVSVTGFAMAVFMSNAGGAWDNAKKYIESGHHGGKGSDCHKAAVVGDTVGDPFKDTSGPSLNILIKLCSTVSIVFSGLILAFHLL